MPEPHSDQKPLSFYQKVIASIVDGHAYNDHAPQFRVDIETGEKIDIRTKKEFVIEKKKDRARRPDNVTRQCK